MSEDGTEPGVAGLRVRLADGVLGCTVDRPDARNALTDAMVDCLETERRQQSMLLRTNDVAEGMAAFSEKRLPSFRGE